MLMNFGNVIEKKAMKEISLPNCFLWNRQFDVSF